MVVINHKIKQKEQVEIEQLWQLQGAKSLSGVVTVEELVQLQKLPYTDRYFRIGKILQVED